jgi:hypothetical protein
METALAILKVIDTLLQLARGLGAKVADIQAATDAEIARIMDQQSKDERADIDAMGLQSKSRGPMF